MAKFVPNSFPQPVVERALEEIGYKQEPVDLRTSMCIFYRLLNGKNSSLPETLTLSYPEVALDGTLWYPRELVIDLFDRLSAVASSEDLILRVVKKLDS